MMNCFKLSLLAVCLLGFFCDVHSSPASQTPKVIEEKKEVTERALIAPTKVPTSKDESVTHSSSCSGLKDFLHLCKKEEPKPTKTVRNVPENSNDEKIHEASGDRPHEEEESSEDDVKTKPLSPNLPKRSMTVDVVESDESSSESDESSGSHLHDTQDNEKEPESIEPNEPLVEDLPNVYKLDKKDVTKSESDDSESSSDSESKEK